MLGPATALINNLRDDVGVWRSIFAVSQNGLLVYQLGSASSAKSRLSWIDRTGKTLADFDPDENTIVDARLSPDNKRVAFACASGIYTLDLERKTKTRVTFDQVLNQQPTWSPDGKALMFIAPIAQGGGNVEIRSKAADGSGIERTVIARAKQLPLSRVVARWEIFDLSFWGRRKNGLSLDCADHRRS